MISAIMSVIRTIGIVLYHCISVGTIYIPNTKIISGISQQSVESYYTGQANQSPNSVSHTAKQQVFDFYWGLSPYLHMVTPATQFLRNWTAGIADVLYSVDQFLTILYTNLFKLMGIKSTYPRNSYFWSLVHYGQLVGIVACIVAVIFYFGIMIVAPQGSAFDKIRSLIQNIILGLAIFSFVPTISNMFASGLEYASSTMLNGQQMGGSGKTMGSVADDMFRYNIISVPHKVASLGLTPDGNPVKTGNATQDKAIDSDSTTNLEQYSIQVPDNNAIIYRHGSQFYTPDSQQSKSIGNMPINSEQIIINLSAMKQSDANSWNGLWDNSIPSFLHEYGSDDSILSPQASDDKWGKNLQTQTLEQNRNMIEDAANHKLRAKQISQCDEDHPFARTTGYCLFTHPKHVYTAHLLAGYNNEKNDEKQAGHKTVSDAKQGDLGGASVNALKTGTGYEFARGGIEEKPSSHATVAPIQKMINTLSTPSVHAATKKGSSNSKKQVAKGNKQQKGAKPQSNSGQSSSSTSLGLFGYQLDGTDDFASIDQIKESSFSKIAVGGATTQYYDKYKVQWFNVFVGLLLLAFVFIAFIAKLVAAFFKVSMMYLGVVIFAYKAISAPQAWKVFIRSFVGIYEMLMMDVITIRVFLIAYFIVNATISDIVYKDVQVNANGVVVGIVQFFADLVLALVAIHGVDAIDKVMGPGANAGASRSWGNALAGVAAVRTTAGLGRAGVHGAHALGHHAVNGAKHVKNGAHKLHHGIRKATGHDGASKHDLRKVARARAKHRSATKNSKYLPNPNVDTSRPLTPPVTKAYAMKHPELNPGAYLNPDYRGFNGGEDAPIESHLSHPAKPDKETNKMSHKNRKRNNRNGNTSKSKAMAQKHMNALRKRKQHQAQHPNGSRMNRLHGGRNSSHNPYASHFASDSASTPDNNDINNESQDTPKDPNDTKAQNLPTGTNALADRLRADNQQAQQDKVNGNDDLAKHSTDGQHDESGTTAGQDADDNVAHYDNNGDLRNGKDNDDTDEDTEAYNVPGTATDKSANQSRNSGTNNPNTETFVPRHHPSHNVQGQNHTNMTPQHHIRNNNNATRPTRHNPNNQRRTTGSHISRTEPTMSTRNSNNPNRQNHINSNNRTTPHRNTTSPYRTATNSKSRNQIAGTRRNGTIPTTHTTSGFESQGNGNNESTDTESTPTPNNEGVDTPTPNDDTQNDVEPQPTDTNSTNNTTATSPNSTTASTTPNVNNNVQTQQHNGTPTQGTTQNTQGQGNQQTTGGHQTQNQDVHQVQDNSHNYTHHISNDAPAGQSQPQTRTINRNIHRDINNNSHIDNQVDQNQSTAPTSTRTAVNNNVHRDIHNNNHIHNNINQNTNGATQGTNHTVVHNHVTTTNHNQNMTTNHTYSNNTAAPQNNSTLQNTFDNSIRNVNSNNTTTTGAPTNNVSTGGSTRVINNNVNRDVSHTYTHNNNIGSGNYGSTPASQTTVTHNYVHNRTFNHNINNTNNTIPNNHSNYNNNPTTNTYSNYSQPNTYNTNSQPTNDGLTNGLFRGLAGGDNGPVQSNRYSRYNTRPHLSNDDPDFSKMLHNDHFNNH